MEDFEEIGSESKWVKQSGLRRRSFYPCGNTHSRNVIEDEFEGEVNGVSEVDDAATSESTSTALISVVWDIFHSKTYNVPVLYFNGYIDSQPLRSLDTLIAQGILKHTEHSGYISITDHPLSRLTCYYIHPCNLSTAVDEIMAAEPHAEYNRVWRMIIDTLVYIS
ncbi:Ubiquitin-like-conjugating enzyme ATG10 [Wallemia ichthyophaga EXF-994]|uniref:Ubiquitin-like-conjugating enzyme ATG10 n=1 Tax=Wallemia ichthyophaga (strain EXF-994 / CBS 113033) TaxID=1299270 RepID=R9AAT0_WALI9|nr:Ubiquitin-like-conjugating enzyme ATG10 [Wallemia ichthyophaga EXF-994]EOQ99276.1 Ubiquitin-like-conjugating enzyme ATG10 [Wallemia ichthyophaga EXF-994]